MSDTTLRSRHVSAAKNDDKSADSNTSVKISTKQQASPRPRIGLLDVLRILLGALVVTIALSYFIHGNVWWNRRPAWAHKNRFLQHWQGERQMTLEDLQQYDGTDETKPIYVVVNGTIYDVSASPRFYGPGGGYHIFAGRDSTRAFVTGCFEDDWTSDLRGVEEMFMPKDLDLPPKLSADATGAEKKAARNLWKLRRDRASRDGKANAYAIVDKWQQRFESGMGGKYFRVGTVKLPSDWKERRGGLRTLCKSAQDSRPETNKWSTWNGKDNI